MKVGSVYVLQDMYKVNLQVMNELCKTFSMRELCGVKAADCDVC